VCRPIRRARGGSEATVRIAKADLVPTEHNLRGGYEDFAALEQACREFSDKVNAREHRVTRRAPVVLLAEERKRLQAVASAARVAAHGLLRPDAAGVLAVDDLGGWRDLLGPVVLG
jgi:hypothetical protein